MKTKVIVAIAVVAVLVIGGGIAAVIALGGSNSSSADITYNYKVGDPIESFDHITETEYETYTAGSGMVFVPVKFIEKNNNVTKDTYTNLEDGYHMYDCDLKYKCSDGNTYSVYDNTEDYIDITDDELTALPKGETRQYTVIVEIPAGTTITDAVWNYSNISAKRNTDLAIDDSIGNFVRGTPSIKYNFIFETTTNTIGTDTAGEGNTFVVYKVIEKNNNVTNGTTPSTLDFDIRCSDGNTHERSGASFTYSDTSAVLGMSLAVGNSAVFHIAYEVSNTVASNTTLVWDDVYSGEYDSTLSFPPA